MEERLGALEGQDLLEQGRRVFVLSRPGLGGGAEGKGEDELPRVGVGGVLVAEDGLGLGGAPAGQREPAGRALIEVVDPEPLEAGLLSRLDHAPDPLDLEREVVVGGLVEGEAEAAVVLDQDPHHGAGGLLAEVFVELLLCQIRQSNVGHGTSRCK